MTKKNNKGGIKEFLEQMPESCDPHSPRVGFDWSSKSIGFGQMYFYVDKADGYVHCDNEGMGREFLKEMLCKMVDNCVLNDPSERMKDHPSAQKYPSNYNPQPIIDGEDILPDG